MGLKVGIQESHRCLFFDNICTMSQKLCIFAVANPIFEPNGQSRQETCAMVDDGADTGADVAGVGVSVDDKQRRHAPARCAAVAVSGLRACLGHLRLDVLSAAPGHHLDNLSSALALQRRHSLAAASRGSLGLGGQRRKGAKAQRSKGAKRTLGSEEQRQFTYYS